MSLPPEFEDPKLNDAIQEIYGDIDRLKKRKRQVISGVTIRTNETVISHSLERVPDEVKVVLYGDARWWITKKDRDKVYLLASAETQADVIVEG